MQRDLKPLKLPPVERIARKAFTALEHFLHIEAASGIVLLMAAVTALVWANSPFAHAYHALWETPLVFSAGQYVFSRPLHFWINDALMTVFFLVVGMEIRREIHEGSLSDFRQAMLPLAAAIGGVVVPALVYFLVNRSSGMVFGWAVPTATDIAFAVGVLALLGRAIPGSRAEGGSMRWSSWPVPQEVSRIGAPLPTAIWIVWQAQCRGCGSRSASCCRPSCGYSGRFIRGSPTASCRFSRLRTRV